MADYRELLRKAVEALPENNGAARRQVYEKARTALVTQLRAIHPPLPPREITQHRLQLEDCIRQVEQQATDVLLGNFRKLEEEPQPAPIVEETTPATGMAADEAVATPVDGDAAADAAEETVAAEAVEEAEALPLAGEAEPEEGEAAETGLPENAAEAEATAGEEAAEMEDAETEAVAGDAALAEPPVVETAQDDGAELAALEAALRAETGDGEGTDAAADVATPDVSPVMENADGNGIVSTLAPSSAGTYAEPPLTGAAKPGSIGYLIGQAQAAADRAAIPARWKQDMPEAGSAVAVAESDNLMMSAASQAMPAEPSVAMSAVREVEVEPEEPEESASNDNEAENSSAAAADDESGDADPQGAIDRAIETLDREARGEHTETPEADDASAAAEAMIAGAEEAAPAQARGGNALTIFLVLFAVLLAGVGGAGYWAWQEGYIDPDAMFGQGGPAQQIAETETPAASEPAAQSQAEGPGNTAATPDAVAPVTQELGKSEERLQSEEPVQTEETAAEDNAATVNGDAAENQTPAAAASTGEDAAGSEDRLPTEGSFDSGETPAAEGTAASGEGGDTDVVAPAGAQSLLLEASAEGTTGAVPYSGTVDWSRGTDETGAPTIIAKANIPARNLSVDLLIRRNADPALPASHLMEVDFTVSESFIGGGIAGLPGILLKNEELVRGTPLVGASARVVGNSFLFALSAADQDVSTNTNLLESRKWLDLALVYATGSRAIITLEKDAAAQTLFDEVMSAWAELDAAAAPAADGAAAAAE